MRPSSSHLTLAALFLACITTLSLIIHTESTHTCGTAQRKRLLSFALQHTQGSIKNQVCESSVLSLGACACTKQQLFALTKTCVVYSVGRPTDLQVIVLEETLSGINIVYVSEPHLHHSNAKILHN